MLTMNTGCLCCTDWKKKKFISFITTCKRAFRDIIKLRSQHQWKTQLYQHQQSLSDINIYK